MGKSGLDAINSVVCRRCGGSGHYSYNQVDGTTCYGCRGTGRVIKTPKGQPKIAANSIFDGYKHGDYPGSDRLRPCVAGDIVEINGCLHRVEAVTWREKRAGGFNFTNQSVRCVRLVDDKPLAYRRGAWKPAEMGSGYTPIDASPAMIGQEATLDDAGEWVRF